MVRPPRLAARCPTCHTTFRVVADQLKLRGGLVRCGRCEAVFDGREHLLTLPDPLPDTPVEAEPVEYSADTTVAPDTVPEQSVDVTDESAYILLANALPQADPGPETETETETPNYASGAFLDREASSDLEGATQLPDTTADPIAPPPASPVAARMRYTQIATRQPRGIFSSTDCGSVHRPIVEDDDALPEFVRKAEAQARAAKSPHRWHWRGVFALLILGALLQALYFWRGTVVVTYPQLRPMLAHTCALLGCDIPPAVHIDALLIDASQLQKPDDTHDHYLLNVSLRNRSNAHVALPALELVLTDLHDGLIVRRALLPQDYLAASDLGLARTGLAPDSELPVQVRFRSRQPAANYRVLMFYP